MLLHAIRNRHNISMKEERRKPESAETPPGAAGARDTKNERKARPMLPSV